MASTPPKFNFSAAAAEPRWQDVSYNTKTSEDDFFLPYLPGPNETCIYLVPFPFFSDEGYTTQSGSSSSGGCSIPLDFNYEFGAYNDDPPLPMCDGESVGEIAAVSLGGSSVPPNFNYELGSHNEAPLGMYNDPPPAICGVESLMEKAPNPAAVSLPLVEDKTEDKVQSPLILRRVRRSERLATKRKLSLGGGEGSEEDSIYVTKPPKKMARKISKAHCSPPQVVPTMKAQVLQPSENLDLAHILDSLGLTEDDIDVSVKDLDANFALKCGPPDPLFRDDFI